MVAVPVEDLASEGLVGAARTGARGQTSIRTSGCRTDLPGPAAGSVHAPLPSPGDLR